MNNNKGFMDWVKYRWKVIQVSDRHFFRFIWSAAISITVITVLISACVIAASNKKNKKKEEKPVVATVTDATTEAPTTQAKVVDTWNLILVNQKNPLPDGFKVPEFVELRNSQKVDSRIYPDLQDMFDKARDEGLSPYITASFTDNVSVADDDKLQELLDSGKTREQAEKELGITREGGGTDEHQTGLAIDVASEEGDTDKEVEDWMKENCYKYGFIVRFPEDKASITGVTEERLHLRYVGKEDAKKIKESGQCLEEYLGRQ